MRRWTISTVTTMSIRLPCYLHHLPSKILPRVLLYSSFTSVPGMRWDKAFRSSARAYRSEDAMLTSARTLARSAPSEGIYPVENSSRRAFIPSRSTRWTNPVLHCCSPFGWFMRITRASALWRWRHTMNAVHITPGSEYVRRDKSLRLLAYGPASRGRNPRVRKDVGAQRTERFIPWRIYPVANSSGR
jgi:hypothetical protein